ncbi:MAG: BON domain-containing protein [Bryobacteraceae bacterium]
MHKTLMSFLLLFALASVCLAKDKQPITDDSIYDQVRMRLANDQVVKGGALQVDVKQGVVTLSGAVDLAEQRDKAPKVVMKVKGVKQVINNITLRSQAPAR